MADAKDRRLDTYSKGMRQRIRVAAALVHEPAVLLLDEPFNGMDPRQRMHMMELLHTMGEQGRTILFSSHILEEVEQVSGTVQVIVAGRLAASGDYRTIRRLMTHRPHVFTIQSSDDRRLAVALMGEASVAGVELDGGGLTVRAGDYGTFTRALPKVALARRIRVQRLVPADESLESVFSYLVPRCLDELDHCLDHRPGPVRPRAGSCCCCRCRRSSIGLAVLAQALGGRAHRLGAAGDGRARAGRRAAGRGAHRRYRRARLRDRRWHAGPHPGQAHPAQGDHPVQAGGRVRRHGAHDRHPRSPSSGLIAGSVARPRARRRRHRGLAPPTPRCSSR